MKIVVAPLRLHDSLFGVRRQTLQQMTYFVSQNVCQNARDRQREVLHRLGVDTDQCGLDAIEEDYDVAAFEWRGVAERSRVF